MIMPGSWAGLLEAFRPVFRRRGTFVLFTVLATGMVAQTGRRSVVGMLSGARMAGAISFHAACRFFSSAVWDLDQMGLVAARLIVGRLLPPGEPVTVVAGDILYKRWGRKVHHAFWTHDGGRPRPPRRWWSGMRCGGRSNRRTPSVSSRWVSGRPATG
jgi:hypothetical protein